MESRGRGRPRLFDHDAALERAMFLFWDRGYEGTSIDALSEAMGISPSSLYKTFGDKEHLFLAANDRYLAGRGGYMAEILKRTPTARVAVERLLEAAAHELTRADQPRGCMIAIGATHYSPDAGDVGKAVRKKRALSVAALRACLKRGIAVGELAAGTDTRELAAFYMGVLQGMSVQARDGASRETLRGMARMAMRAWPG